MGANLRLKFHANLPVGRQGREGAVLFSGSRIYLNKITPVKTGVIPKLTAI